MIQWARRLVGYNPAAPVIAPRFHPPDNSLIRFETACSFPVPVV
jgi:hypothetical protein